MNDEDWAVYAQHRLDDWQIRAIWWYRAYYVLGALAVALTVTVASRPNFVSSDPEFFAALAWLAAIFQGLSTFLAASRKAIAYRAAWRALWLARVDYIASSKGPKDVSNLKQVIANGWATIDGGYVESSDARGRPSRQKDRAI